MEYPKSLDQFFERDNPFQKELYKLREILLKSELEEKLKWGMPVYCLDNKNVVGIAAFKNHFGLWFYQGALLKDPQGVITNAQEGKTKAMRQWRMTTVQEIKEKQILEYVSEAKANQKAGITVKIEKTKPKKLVLEGVFKTSLEKDAKMKAAFGKLTPAKQVEYAAYISEAKQEKTKLSRIDKIMPLIKSGVGLSELWKK